MYVSYKLKSPLGRSYNANLDDVRKTKEILHRLGYYAIPTYGLTAYPDDALFKGIENFQKDYRLRQDGVMTPGGETETTLRAILRAADQDGNGPFVSTVAVVDAAVAVHAAVAVATVVIGSGPDDFNPAEGKELNFRTKKRW